MQKLRSHTYSRLCSNNFSYPVEPFKLYSITHNYNKILKSDWLSTVLISALIGQCKRTVHVMPKKLGVSWCCGYYCLLAFVLWCGYCSVSFQSFVLRHWCPQHQETTKKLDSVHHRTCTLKWLFFTACKRTHRISCVFIFKRVKTSQILL